LARRARGPEGEVVTAVPLHAVGPALAAMEIATVARGIVVLDQMAKRAEVSIVSARTLSPGRYLIVLSGRIADIEEAMAAARDTADDDRVDDVVLRDPPRDLRDALASRLRTAMGESLAIVETATVCAS